MLVVNRVDANGTATPSSREYISYSGTSGTTVLIETRNVDSGGSVRTHAVGSIVEFIPDVVWADSIYDTLGLIVDPSDISTLDSTKVVTPTATQTLTNKTLTSPVLNTGVSGTAVKDEDDMASDSATALATQQSIKAYVDTNASSDGWIAAGETWTYSAFDDTNGVSTASITVPSDATTKYQKGMRVKFDQTTDGTKYGIITKVEATTLTVFINTDYDFDNETITNPYFSTYKAPFGFDLNPDKWKVETTDSANRSQASPTQNTWYNLGTITIDVPVGDWNVSYQLVLRGGSVETTLSTANNTESDADFSSFDGSGTTDWNSGHSRNKNISLSTKDTYYLNARTLASGVSQIAFRGDIGTTIVRASCAYL